MMLTEVLPETLPDAQAVKGFFDSLTWQKVIPPLVLLLVGLVAVRLLLRLFDRALERSRLERAAYAMLRSVMKVLLYFILLLLVAAQLGVDAKASATTRSSFPKGVPRPTQKWTRQRKTLSRTGAAPCVN